MVLDNDIIKALRKYRGIVASTAKEVGMTRSSLSRRIHRTKHLEEELHEIRETAVDDAGFCCRTGSGLWPLQYHAFPLEARIHLPKLGTAVVVPVARRERCAKTEWRQSAFPIGAHHEVTGLARFEWAVHLRAVGKTRGDDPARLCRQLQSRQALEGLAVQSHTESGRFRYANETIYRVQPLVYDVIRPRLRI